jgi:hypothetical protein
MIDLVGAIGGTAVYALITGVLVGLSQESGRAKFAAFGAAVFWGSLIVAVGALGGFRSGVAGPVPMPVLAFLCLLALLFASWFALPRVRIAILSVPLPALVGVNAARLGGVFFLILTANGRLTGPFGPWAGWGDIIVGALAIPVSVGCAKMALRSPAWIKAWNVLGALDLVNAVTLGLLSAPGVPFRVLTVGPGTSALGILPWVMVPAMLVLLYLFIHFVIPAKLKRLRQSTQEVWIPRVAA